VEKNDQAFHHLPELCSSTPDIAGVAYLKYTIHVKSYQRYVLGCFVISSFIYIYIYIIIENHGETKNEVMACDVLR